jgi:hypothetical protein
MVKELNDIQTKNHGKTMRNCLFFKLPCRMCNNYTWELSLLCTYQKILVYEIYYSTMIVNPVLLNCKL